MKFSAEGLQFYVYRSRNTPSSRRAHTHGALCVLQLAPQFSLSWKTNGGEGAVAHQLLLSDRRQTTAATITQVRVLTAVATIPQVRVSTVVAMASVACARMCACACAVRRAQPYDQLRVGRVQSAASAASAASAPVGCLTSQHPTGLVGSLMLRLLHRHAHTQTDPRPTHPWTHTA